MKNEKGRQPISKPLVCQPKKTDWTDGVSFTVNKTGNPRLKTFGIYFSPGCNGYVEVRLVRKSGGILAPTESGGSGYVGDDVRYPIYLNKKLIPGDTLVVQYKNSDTSSHTVIPTLEVEYDVIEGPSKIGAPTPEDIRIEPVYPEDTEKTEEDNVDYEEMPVIPADVKSARFTAKVKPLPTLKKLLEEDEEKFWEEITVLGEEEEKEVSR